jgi:hypothetical protein
MQKLSGKSMVVLYKSFRIFHSESNKIGFAFFLIFLRFSTNFQRFSKSTLLFENPTFSQAPGTFLPITDRPLVHEKDPGKNEGDTM